LVLMIRTNLDFLRVAFQNTFRIVPSESC
jgi:hypothetical protein